METKTTPTEPMEEPEAVEAEPTVVGFEPIDDQPATSEPVRPRDERKEFNDLTPREREIMGLVKKSLRSAARKLNNDANTVKDLVEEEQDDVFMKVINKLQEQTDGLPNDNANISRWLSTVSYNHLVSRYNRDSKRQTSSLNEINPTTEEEFIESLPDESADTEEQALSGEPSEEVLMLRDLVANLENDQQREIMELTIQGLSDVEIAKRMKMNPVTVRTNKTRATQKLKERLNFRAREHQDT